jgi:hypothetical protein
MSSDAPELAQPLVGVEGLAWVGLRRLARKIDLVIGTVSEAAGAGWCWLKRAFSLPALSHATSSTTL